MSQGDKSRLFQALKAAGVDFTKHYREYTTADLQKKHDELVAAGVIQLSHPSIVDAPPVQSPPSERPGLPTAGEQPLDADAAAFFGYTPPEPEHTPPAAAAPAPEPPSSYTGVSERDPATFAGQHLNSKAPDEPLRTDEHGRIWYQEEVLKPATPRPRGRRVLDYVNTGTVTEQITLDDGTVETFEVAGKGTSRAQVKITLPSYQVGIFKDPRFLFVGLRWWISRVLPRRPL